MVPSRPTEQRKATAAAPRAGSGQHSSPSSPSSGAARASAGEALFWCLLGEEICDEICDVLCEVLNDDVDADDADDAARGAGALTASAASTLKGRRAEGAAGSAARPADQTCFVFLGPPAGDVSGKGSSAREASLLGSVLATENHFFYGESRTK